MPHLNNWALVGRPIGYSPPEANICLNGYVSGHPRFPDGHHITTTRILKILEMPGCVGNYQVYTKSGSAYTLGEPHPDYEAQFPNAKDRLFKGELL